MNKNRSICIHCRQPIAKRISFGGEVWEHYQDGFNTWCDVEDLDNNNQAEPYSKASAGDVVGLAMLIHTAMNGGAK